MEPAARPAATASTSAPERSHAVLVGLLGSGIQLSRTPAMHEAEATARGIPFVYRLLDTDLMGTPSPALPDILRFAEYFGFSGLNVTFPFKQAILPLLDELSSAAREVGSVNTVAFRDGRRVGHNTDVWGFRENLRQGMDGAGRRQVLMLGAGGAGAAVGHALLDSGVGRLTVSDTDGEKTRVLVDRLNAHFGAGRAMVGEDIAAAARASDGIVNATPVGMTKLPGMPIPADCIEPRHWVADVVYFPLETELLAHARKKGCRTLSGEGMAIFQAVRAFELFTGVKPDTDRMKAAFAAFDGGSAVERTGVFNTMGGI